MRCLHQRRTGPADDAAVGQPAESLGLFKGFRCYLSISVSLLDSAQGSRCRRRRRGTQRRAAGMMSFCGTNTAGETFMSMSQGNLDDLRYAKSLLENPGLAAKITNYLGKPIEKGFERLPARWSDVVSDAVRASLRRAL